jgi:ABC-type amino acid transport substrate-binding protein
MKKYILLFLLIVAAIVYNVFFNKTERVIRIGVECNHEPYNWEEKRASKTNFPLVNNPGFYVEGYDVQMAKAIAEEIGARVEFYKIHFDALIDALLIGEIDAIFSGMVDTDERKELINFTVPYEVRKVKYAVLMNKKSRYASASSVRDLKGARMVAQKDSRFDAVIEQIPNVVHMTPLRSQTEIIDAIVNLRADGTVLNYDTGLSYQDTHSDLVVIYFSGDEGFELGFTGLCAGLRKNDKKLLDEFNSVIEEMSQRQRQRIMDLTIKSLWENM